ncbi:MAG: hypothetical protein GH155_07970 [Spirochaeta sp.]|nr:hypothetical protein [Spirochaeta sp.]
MNEVNKSLSLWLFLYLILLNQGVTAQDFKAEIKSELEDLQVFKNRCQAQWPGCRLLLIQEQEKTEPIVMRVGFSTPLITWGPLSHFGLARMVLNPLGYSPGSTVFTESSDFRLDCSFGGGSRRGCIIEPLPDRLGLFLWEGEGLPLKVGAFVELRPVSRLQLESIYLTGGAIRAESHSDQWFGYRAPFAGGRFHHLGGRVSWQTPLLHIYSSLAACGGELLMPGYFVNIDLRLQNRFFPLELLMGCCSVDYFTPDGEIIDDWLRFGAESEYCLSGAAVISLTYQRKVLHGLHGRRYLPGWESLGFSAEKEFKTGQEATITVESAATGKIDYDQYGKSEQSITLKTAVELSNAGRELAGCFSGEWGEEELPEKKFYLKGSRRSENSFLALEWRTCVKEAASHSLLLEIEVKGPSQPGSTTAGSRRFYLKGGIENLPAEEWRFLMTGPFPFADCSIKIGWEAEN